ncbi:MAG: CBS domain-containing protein [Candidatus Cloacimonetes bacterium]|nr:CBS domain-containing protein [Candidatus Cloacimonadota bacterium]
MNRKLNELCTGDIKIHTIKPDETIKNAVDILNKNRIGSLIVMDDNEKIYGILSERDILIKLAETNVEDDIHNTAVREVMTKKEKLIVGNPDDTLEYLMNVMLENKIRHMPIVDENGKLKCLISIRDIIKFLLKESKQKVKYLRDYVQGKYPG